jgi:chromosome segregation ATPase
MRNETLQDINQSINSIPALDQRRMRLLERIGESREQERSLKTIYEGKLALVDKLQQGGLAAAAQKILGRSGKKLDQGMVEMHAAKLDFEKEREHLKDLDEENGDLLRRITNLKKRQAVLQDEIIRREKEISANKDHDLFEKYKKIQEESSAAATQLVENEEALKAAQKVVGSARASLEELENAEHWTTSDMWGGSGLVSRTTKLSKIDHAQSTFNRLSTQMKDLERELADVQLPEKTILSTISTANHMVEFWFDNILSGKDVAAVLRSNQAQLRVLVSQVLTLIETLERNDEELKTRMAHLEEEKANLIVTCRSCQNDDGEGTVCG